MTTQITVRQRRALRAAILTEVVRAGQQSAALARSLDDIVEAAQMSNVDDEHDPEGTTIAFERAQVTALLRHAQLEAAALGAALERVEDADYGVCRTCAGFIGIERLLALPAAQQCIRCAR